MEGGPAPNVYNIPAAIGFVGHTPNKCRLPSVTIGRKRDAGPSHGHGPLYDLRDQTRFGRLRHRAKCDFAGWRPIISEGLPAPNFYYPKIDMVRPKQPQISFKSRTLLGRADTGYPAPNAYTLPPATQPSKIPIQFSNRKSLLHGTSEGVPAPNTYQLTPMDAYKYGRAPKVSMMPRRQPLKDNFTPPPNSYHLPTAKSSAKTFGQQPSYKRLVYVTVEDLAC